MSNTYCIFSANYLPNIGGVEKYTQNLALALESLGQKSIIVTNNCFSLASYEKLSDNIEIFRLPCFPLIDGRLPLPRKNSEYKKLLIKLTSKPIDFVMINTRFYPHTFTGIKVAEKKNIRPIVLDHGSAYLTFGNSFIDFFVKRWEHGFTWLLKHHDIDFYGVSSASEKWLQTFGITSKGALCNAIDTDTFVASSSGKSFKKEYGLNKEDFVVSYMGRFIPEKGIVSLIETSKILEDNHKIHFFLAGDGPLTEYVNINKTSNVHLLGRLDSRDVSAMLLESDVFCSPTRSEGFSTSLLEATACAATPIITNVGGVRELLENGNRGIILRTAEPEEIAKAILDLYEDRLTCIQIGKEAQSFTKNNFSWEQTALKVIKACKKAQENS